MAKTSKKNAQKEGYFKGVRKELGLVKWPDGKSVAKNTVATVVMCLVVCAFFLLLNLCLAWIKGWFV